ncbi:MAG: zinc-dependent alcohol dehydrogenase [Omnitrophica WOR_2 bacterium]
MKGLFITDRNNLEVLELPEPKLGPYEALVQVEACGICNSTDWKLIEGEFVSGSFPVLLGHESVGRVIRKGRNVRNFREGDRVLRSTLRDEHVPFRGGRSCWGGFVEKAIVTDVWAEKNLAYNAFPHPQQVVPPDIPPDQATLLITLKETLSCLENTGVQTGQSLAITGSGPVAQALTCFARLAGISPLVVFGRQPDRGPLFTRLGADAYNVGDSYSPEVQDILRRGGFDRVIEAVGSRAALTRSLKLAGKKGKVNLYGIAPESEPYLPVESHDPRVFRSKVAEAEVHDRLLGWIAEGKIRLADWISRSLPWTDYRQGFEMVRNKSANKVVLLFT